MACHSGERARGGFQIVNRAALLQGGKRGEPAVVPGQPDASPLIHFVQEKIEDMEMPPIGRRDKFPSGRGLAGGRNPPRAREVSAFIRYSRTLGIESAC